MQWAVYIREVLKEYVQQYVKTVKFEGIVEIDKSCFGRKVKHHRGNPRGNQLWVVGLVERSSNRIILYPVDNRNVETMRLIITTHIKPGSRILTDGWAAYNWLNNAGYKHFNVIHKHTFTQQYKNTQTGEVIATHTNTIEGAWQHCKERFKAMHGTNVVNFESHIADVTFRNH